MLGDVNKLFVFKSLLTIPSIVLPLHLKQTFPPIFWIFTEGEGDGIFLNLFYFKFLIIRIKITGLWQNTTAFPWFFIATIAPRNFWNGLMVCSRLMRLISRNIRNPCFQGMYYNIDGFFLCILHTSLSITVSETWDLERRANKNAVKLSWFRTFKFLIRQFWIIGQ